MPRGRQPKPNEWLEYGYSEEEWKGFHKSKRWRIKNPGKQQESTRRWKENNKEYNRDRQRKYNIGKYGITEEDFDLLLEAQNHQCAICKTNRPTGKWKRFAIDHCHITGKVRGLLCNECNRGMGLLKDSPYLLRAAAQYLEDNN